MGVHNWVYHLSCRIFSLKGALLHERVMALISKTLRLTRVYVVCCLKPSEAAASSSNPVIQHSTWVRMLKVMSQLIAHSIFSMQVRCPSQKWAGYGQLVTLDNF